MTPLVAIEQQVPPISSSFFRHRLIEFSCASRVLVLGLSILLHLSVYRYRSFAIVFPIFCSRLIVFRLQFLSMSFLLNDSVTFRRRAEVTVVDITIQDERPGEHTRGTHASPHRLYDLHDILRDKLMHSFHSRHMLSPSKTGSKVFAHRLMNITLLTLVQSKLLCFSKIDYTTQLKPWCKLHY